MTEPARSAARPAADADIVVAALSEQYLGRLRMFAARRLRGDFAAADDVAQEALKTVLEALRAGRVRQRDAIAAFAYETVRHLCMHRARSLARETRALVQLSLVAPQAASDALDALITDERLRRVRDAVGEMEEDDRRVLEMTYVQASSSEEIGRALGVSPGAVRIRRHRALRRLSALLGVTKVSGPEQED